MEKTEILSGVIRTLNVIDVRGSANLNHMLGCINALQALLEQISQEEAATNVSNYDGDRTGA